MFRHNILIALRNFRRYKSSFLINLIGLSTGLASVLLIYLWVNDEFSMDKFHEKDGRLFQVMRNIDTPAGIETTESNSVLLPNTLTSEMPEVECSLPARPVGDEILTYGDKSVNAAGWFAGKDFFNVFSYPLVVGDKDQVLNDNLSVVLSEQLAITLFGSAEKSIGKTLTWDITNFGSEDYIVSGVFSKVRQSSQQFDFLASYDAFLKGNRMDVNWQSNPIMTYITLKPGTSVESFNKKLNQLYVQKRGDEAYRERGMFIEPFSDKYLHGRFENGYSAGGKIDYVLLFSAIAVFILIIACINFMNLSTARASRRFKEVGVKKAIGAWRKSLVFQYLSESVVMAMISLVISVMLVLLLLPKFNQITGKELVINQDWSLLIGVAIITLITGLIAGSYPALYLSGFKPIQILSGRFNPSKGSLLIRKGLVVFQFSTSMILIVATVIIFKQMEFVRSKNLGYQKENVLIFDREGKLKTDLDVFKTQASSLTGVLGITTASESITQINSTSSGHAWEGQVIDGDQVQFAGLNVNYDFFETLGLEMATGRSFSPDFGDEQSKIVLNEAAIKAMGISDPVGKWIELFGQRKEIIGVSKDFHFQSMYEEIKPLFIMLNPKYTSKVLVRMQAGSERTAINQLEKLYHEFNAGVPFEVKFLNDEYQSVYASEERVAGLSEYFSAIAIIISCLGLFGLAAFTVELRSKEVSIRKILGSKVTSIMLLLSKDFTETVLISMLISIPISYFLSKNWLDAFAYRIDLSGWVFIGSAALVLFLAGLIVSLQTIKMARANPIKFLRNE